MNLTTCLRVLLLLRRDLWTLCPPEVAPPNRLCLCHPRGWQECLPEAQKAYCNEVKNFSAQSSKVLFNWRPNQRRGRRGGVKILSRN